MVTSNSISIMKNLFTRSLFLVMLNILLLSCFIANPSLSVMATASSIQPEIETNGTADTAANVSEAQGNKTVDKFGITRIYPTEHNGREWYVNMDDPSSDGIFNTTSKLTRQIDGSWRVNAQGLPGDREGAVRLQVFTPPGEQEWKNVEITGYVKVVRTAGHDSDKKSDLEDILQWYARGGKHSSNSPCEGTSLKGRIHLNGTVSWAKEIWHDGGYTFEKAGVQATSPLVMKKSSGGRYHDGRWFGYKVVMYNIDHDKAVKMETYLDENADNNWRKVTELVDNGDWYSYDPHFYDVNCGRPPNYIVTNGGPIAAFRSDDIIWDFKDLSIREISAG